MLKPWYGVMLCRFKLDYQVVIKCIVENYELLRYAVEMDFGTVFKAI